MSPYAKHQTAAEKRAAREAVKSVPGVHRGGRKPGSFTMVDCEPIRVARHCYAAIKRMAIAEKRTLADVTTELLNDAIARKLGLDPAEMPSRRL